MAWFQDLLIEIIPLYLISALGFLAGRIFKIDFKSITTLSIYFIAPVVFFFTVAQLDASISLVIAPMVILVLLVALSFSTFHLFKAHADKKFPYLMALCSSNNNWGYFGLPIAFAVLDQEAAALFILIGFGLQISDNSLGIYFVSRGHKSPLESVKNVFQMPTIYAIALGLLFSFLNIPIPEAGNDILELFKATFVVLGMMIIGMGLASLEKFNIDKLFVGFMVLQKFIIFPLLTFLLITVDRYVGVLGEAFYKPLLLISIMPMAANHIAYAAQFDMNPGKVSVGVLMTTLLAVVYIPFAIWFLEI